MRFRSADLRSGHRRVGLVLLLVLVVLIGVRLALPGVVRDQLNQRLDRMGDYHGHVDRVSLHLWRGAYTLHHLTIVKLGGKVPVPLLTTDLDIAVSWNGLIHGGIVGRAEFDRPLVSFVDGGGKGADQSGKGADWRAQLAAIVPIRLDEVVIHQGTLSFRNFNSQPPVDLRAQHLEATVRNLTNVRGVNDAQVATLEARADLFGTAPSELKARFNPFSEPIRDFDFTLQIADVELRQANDFIRAYAGLDVAGGHGQLNLELHAKNGHVTGYAKPLVHDLKIFSWHQDVTEDHKNPLQLAWEASAELVTKLFTNLRNDQFGTRIPIEGDVGNTEAGIVPSVFGIVRNAFVEAYRPGFDQLRENAKPAPK